jgi:hypothetical protein
MKNICVMFVVCVEWQRFVLQAFNIPGNTEKETDTKKSFVIELSYLKHVSVSNLVESESILVKKSLT